MKKTILFILFFLYVFTFSQDFTYCESLKNNFEKSETIKTFNSKEGLFFFKSFIHGVMNENYTVKIVLTNEEKSKIVEYLNKNQINGFELCRISDEYDLDYKMNFELIGDSKKMKCADNEKITKIKHLDKMFNDLITSKPEYRKVFYWEFVWDNDYPKR